MLKSVLSVSMLLIIVFDLFVFIDFGIGLGDNRYEKSVRKDNASIEQAINKLIETFNFDKEGRSIFIGGFSVYTQYLATRFGLGMNLWKKDPKHLGKLVSSKNDNNKAVSYTHLTLPTICSV